MNSTLNCTWKPILQSGNEFSYKIGQPSVYKIKTVQSNFEERGITALTYFDIFVSAFRILEMKKWSDEVMVQCLAGTLGDKCFTEDEEVVEARMVFLEKRKRYTSGCIHKSLSCR